MAGDTMIQRLEMKVLIDNVAEGSLVGEWGLSIMIDADDMRILLDTGASGLFAQNADCLNIDLESVDIQTHIGIGYRMLKQDVRPEDTP